MTIPPLCPCGSGQPPCAIKPGTEPEYARSRDLFGRPSDLLPPIPIRAGQPDTYACLACWPVKAQAA